MTAFLNSPAGGLTILGFLIASLLFYVWARRRDLRMREERPRNGTYTGGRPPSQFVALIVLGAIVVSGETLTLLLLRATLISAILLLAGIASVVIGIIGYIRVKRRLRAGDGGQSDHRA